jgi:dipeptidyl aminopeptidase/acylaminoacyl peptidase
MRVLDLLVVCRPMTALLLLIWSVGCASQHDASDPGRNEAVEFVGGDLTLKGTLELPEGAAEHRWPAVVLVHGSGPVSRDAPMNQQLAMSFGCTIRVFAELSHALAAAGYAVLRYDKRTCGPFNGCAQNGYPRPSNDMTVDQLVDDASAALTWMAERDDIDSERIFLVGHSKGATFAPRLIERHPTLAGAVLLAGPYRPIDETMVYQAGFVRQLVDELGTPTREDAEYVAELEGFAAELRALRAGTYGGQTLRGAGLPYWESWMALGDSAPLLAKAAPKPLFVLSGDYDWNVPPAETALWQAALTEATPNVPHRTRVVPCVTHALNCVSQPDYRQIRVEDIGCRVSRDVVREVVAFLNEVSTSAN